MSFALFSVGEMGYRTIVLRFSAVLRNTLVTCVPLTPLGNDMHKRLPLEQAASLAKLLGQNFGLRYPRAYLTDDMARDPPPEIHFTHVFPSKMVNFYPPTPVYDLTGDWLTKSDEDPGCRDELCQALWLSR